MTRVRPDQRPTQDALRFLGSRHRRRPTLAVASLALVTLCVAIFTNIYVHAGNRVAVLAVAHDVPQGHAVTSHDLLVVSISLSGGLAPIPARYLGRVVGRKAAVSLVSGTLLTLNELTGVNDPAPGHAVVGVATKAGQLPAGGVAIGDTVDVLLTGSSATLSAGGSGALTSTSGGGSSQQLEIGGVLAPRATVIGVANPRSSSSDPIVVSVLVPSNLAPLVASASAAGQVALALVGPSS
jgi:hypothetical protein